MASAIWPEKMDGKAHQLGGPPGIMGDPPALCGTSQGQVEVLPDNSVMVPYIIKQSKDSSPDPKARLTQTCQARTFCQDLVRTPRTSRLF